MILAMSLAFAPFEYRKAKVRLNIEKTEKNKLLN